MTKSVQSSPISEPSSSLIQTPSQPAHALYFKSNPAYFRRHQSFTAPTAIFEFQLVSTMFGLPHVPVLLTTDSVPVWLLLMVFVCWGSYCTFSSLFAQIGSECVSFVEQLSFAQPGICGAFELTVTWVWSGFGVAALAFIIMKRIGTLLYSLCWFGFCRR